MPKARNYDRDNEQAAGVILANPTCYPGLPQIWAELWMSRHGVQRKKVAGKLKLLPPAARRRSSAARSLELFRQEEDSCK